jgi:hypothetical protein
MKRSAFLKSIIEENIKKKEGKERKESSYFDSLQLVAL